MQRAGRRTNHKMFKMENTAGEIKAHIRGKISGLADFLSGCYTEFQQGEVFGKKKRELIDKAYKERMVLTELLHEINKGL